MKAKVVTARNDFMAGATERREAEFIFCREETRGRLKLTGNR